MGKLGVIELTLTSDDVDCLTIDGDGAASPAVPEEREQLVRDPMYPYNLGLLQELRPNPFVGVRA
jgi:hypothetical protein